MPTPLTPGVSAARGDAAAGGVLAGSRADAAATAGVNRITAEVAWPRRANKHTRNLLVAAGVVMLAAAGWMAFKDRLPGATSRGDRRGRRPAPPPAPAAPAPAPTAVDAATGLPAGDAPPTRSMARSSPGSLPVPARSTPRSAMRPLANVRYGHGGPNQSPRNRVRVRPVKEPSAAELAIARKRAGRTRKPRWLPCNCSRSRPRRRPPRRRNRGRGEDPEELPLPRLQEMRSAQEKGAGARQHADAGRTDADHRDRRRQLSPAVRTAYSGDRLA